MQRPGLSVWAHTATSFYRGRYLKGTVVSAGQNVDIAGNELESVPHVTSRSGVSIQARGLTASALLTYADESFAGALNTMTPSAPPRSASSRRTRCWTSTPATR